MWLIFKDEALKHLKKIGTADSKKAQRKIEYLQTNPLAGKPLQGEHRGKYSLKAWPLRIIYTFDPKKNTITIETVDYRGGVYKK